MLSDPDIQMIVNLTTSSSHFEVSKACLEAGKHLYSEKPLAITLTEAQQLVDLAKAKGLYFSGAPASLLGETAQTLWKALRSKAIGKVRVVYANLDDGPLHLGGPHLWHSASGAPYDYREEFQAGVTAEHAGYYLSWLVAFFGPAKTITSFSSCLWPDWQVTDELALNLTTPDFTVACIAFESGVVARLTCGLVACHSECRRRAVSRHHFVPTAAFLELTASGGAPGNALLKLRLNRELEIANPRSRFRRKTRQVR